MAETCNGAFLFTMAGAPRNSVQGECDKEGETGLVERDEASIIHVVVLRVLQRDKPPWTTVHTRTTTSRRRRRRRDVWLQASHLLSLSFPWENSTRCKLFERVRHSKLEKYPCKQLEITIDTMHLEDLEIDLFLAAKGRRHARSTSLRFSTYIRRETPWMRGLRDEICKRRSRWSVESTRGSVSDAGCRWNNVYLRKIIYDIGWVVVKWSMIIWRRKYFFFLYFRYW